MEVVDHLWGYTPSNGRNPLSLDMGWKFSKHSNLCTQLQSSQSAFAGYGLEGKGDKPCNTVMYMSQSAFAGYGLEGSNDSLISAKCRLSQSAFAGYGLEVADILYNRFDVDWSQSAFAGYGLEENGRQREHEFQFVSQSAFAGYGLEVKFSTLVFFRFIVAIRFRWIWVGSSDHITFQELVLRRNPLSLDMGWKEHSINTGGRY